MDKNLLTASRISGEGNRAPVEIPGVGTVTVRGLSRHEFLEAQKLSDQPARQERYLLACCMLDPEMNEDDVAAWQKGSSPAEINTVAKKVNELSGIGQGAEKSEVPEPSE